jgi:hypothetical protein
LASAKAVLQTPPIITSVPTIQAARSLPTGSIVGDMYGGLTFSDAVAAVLESRSVDLWREAPIEGQSWTIIVLHR